MELSNGIYLADKLWISVKVVQKYHAVAVKALREQKNKDRKTK